MLQGVDVPKHGKQFRFILSALSGDTAPPSIAGQSDGLSYSGVMKKLALLIAASLLLTPSALATDFVTKSNLTGIALPKGALELTDDDFSDEMVDLLEDVAATLNGKCQYHELLYWEGNPTALAKSLGANIPSTLKYTSLDVGDVDNGTYEQFSLTNTKVWYAGVWIDSPDDVILAWCSVVKK